MLCEPVYVQTPFSVLNELLPYGSMRSDEHVHVSAHVDNGFWE